MKSKPLALAMLLITIWGLGAMGCAMKEGPTSPSPYGDAEAVHEMEWNLDPWR